MGNKSPPAKRPYKRKQSRQDLRRVWKAGDSWVVSLPLDWVEEYNLELCGLYLVKFEGDDKFISLVPAEVTDELETVKILISADDASKFKSAEDVCKENDSADTGLELKKTISKSLIDEMKESERNKERRMKEAESAYNKLLRKIVATYLIGFNNIQVLCDKNCSSKTLPDWFLKRIEKFIRTEDKLFGARCQTPSLECLEINVNVEIRQYPLRKALDDMCEYAKKALGLALELLKSFDEKKLENLQSFENEVDARYFYIVRSSKLALKSPQLAKDMKLRNYRQLMGYRVIAKPIERIADHSYKIALTLQELVQEKGDLGSEARSAAIKLGNHVSQIFDHMTKSLYAKGGFFNELNTSMYVQRGFFDEANELIEEASGVIAEEENIFRELNRRQEEEGEERKTGCKKTALEIWSERVILESLRRIADYTVTVGQTILNLCVDSRLEKEKAETEKISLLKPSV